MANLIREGFDMRDMRKSLRHDRMVLVERLGTVLFYQVRKTHAPLNIVNEANLTGGENVGGSTAAPAAPEVAADDDDGDGDADPEPERRPRHRTTLPPSVEHFDRLPDSAHIDLPALRALTGKSRATLYRWIERGILPPPRKLGLTRNFWTAGDVRRALQA